MVPRVALDRHRAKWGLSPCRPSRPPGEIGAKWNEAIKKERDHSSDAWKKWGRKHGGTINDDE